MLVIHLHVVGVYRKEGIDWSIPSDPVECLEPVIRLRYSRPLDVGACGEQLTLNKIHHATNRQEQDDPAPRVALQNALSQEAATQQKQEDIQQMQTAHRLKPRQRLKAFGNRQHQRGHKVEETIDNQ